MLGKPMVITDGCEMAPMLKDRVADIVPFDATAFAAAMSDLLTDRSKCDTARLHIFWRMKNSPSNRL